MGGYGNFGARIVRRLAARSKDTGLSLIAAGRHPERGHAACGFDASIVQARLDIWDPDFPSLGVGLAVPLKGRRG